MARGILDAFKETDRRSFLHVVISLEMETLEDSRERGQVGPGIALEQIDDMISEVAQVHVQELGVELRRLSVRLPAGMVRRTRFQQQIDHVLAANHLLSPNDTAAQWRAHEAAQRSTRPSAATAS